MSVRMIVEKYVIGTHDPRVIVGSSPDKGINWEPGTEIEVVDELADKFERSGMALRVDSLRTFTVPIEETASMATEEKAIRQNPVSRRRARA